MTIKTLSELPMAPRLCRIEQSIILIYSWKYVVSLLLNYCMLQDLQRSSMGESPGGSVTSSLFLELIVQGTPYMQSIVRSVEIMNKLC